MWRFIFITIFCTLGLTSATQAANSTRFKLSITPLECITDAIDDGLHINFHANSAACDHAGPPENMPGTTLPDQAKNHTEDESIPNAKAQTETTSDTPYTSTTPSINPVTYHATILGFSRQSVLRTVVISLGTMGTVSFALFIIRFFLP